MIDTESRPSCMLGPALHFFPKARLLRHRVRVGASPGQTICLDATFTSLDLRDDVGAAATLL
jgi:hypothetical protein